MYKKFNIKIIFSYYVSNEFSVFHKWHLINFNNMLSCFDSTIFDDINFYLLIDDVNNIDLIEKTKNNILNYIDNRFIINFHIVQNNSIYREGLIYKTEIIDKLNQYDDNQLIIFLHSKGVSNELNIINFKNTLYWISLMYFFNLYNTNEILEKFYKEDIVTYGTLYNYDDSSLVKYKWQYTGSFHWIYPSRFIKYINSKNISFKTIKEKYCFDGQIRICAEAFVGDNIETDYVGFIDDNLFNKKYSHFLFDHSLLPYTHILYIASDVTSVEHHNIFLDYFDQIYEVYKNEITNDL